MGCVLHCEPKKKRVEGMSMFAERGVRIVKQREEWKSGFACRERERESLAIERASRGGATRGRLGGRVGRAQSVTKLDRRLARRTSFTFSLFLEVRLKSIVRRGLPAAHLGECHVEQGITSTWTTVMAQLISRHVPDDFCPVACTSIKQTIKFQFPFLPHWQYIYLPPYLHTK